jgi:ATP-dependent Clp protease ATP-binding subunit ClpX
MLVIGYHTPLQRPPQAVSIAQRKREQPPIPSGVRKALLSFGAPFYSHRMVIFLRECFSMLSTDSSPSPSPRRLLTPMSMEAALDRTVHGQTEAKRTLCVGVYQHYLSRVHRTQAGEDLGRNHVLLIGPTGSGKTMMVKALAELLGVPFVAACTTSLVESGYRGRPVEDIIRALLHQSGNEPRKAEWGIVFLDEIDKIRRQCVGGGRDISGEGVQNSLLTLLDGRVCDAVESVAIPAVDTSRILFVCAGAFEGLEEIVTNRIQSRRSGIGFQSKSFDLQLGTTSIESQAILAQLETKDLIEYGMIPEFIGRFAHVGVLNALSRNDLRAILFQSSHRSPLYQRQQVARLHGISLKITDDAIDAIADLARAMGTGARALHRILGQALQSVEYRWPELADDHVVQVIIDHCCITDATEPKLIRGRSETARRDHVLRSLFGFDSKQPSVPACRPSRSPVAVDRPPGWEWESFEAQRFWEQLERNPDGTRRSMADIARELRVCGATLGEYYAASDESLSSDPHRILETMLEIRHRDGGGVEPDGEEDDGDWSEYDPEFDPEFDLGEFDEPF